VAGLGRYKGVAHLYGVKLTGLPASFLHRTYHLSRIPVRFRCADGNRYGVNKPARVVERQTRPP
jgi:hypothetical protein